MLTKYAIAFCIGIGLSVSVQSQTLTPNVISSAGNIDKTDKISLEWTLGETATGSLLNSVNSLTEGYHQPGLFVNEIIKDLASTYGITVAPNPVMSLLTISVFSEEDTKLDIRLLNMDAKILKHITANSRMDTKEINMSVYENGLYILNIRSASGSLNTSYKISKIQ